MTRKELRDFLFEHFCGCGAPEAAAETLLFLLRHPNDYKIVNERITDEGAKYILLYYLAALDLTEHGSNVGASWLTDKGEEVREALTKEEVDNFDSLFADDFS
jgi:hypothetical protein